LLADIVIVGVAGIAVLKWPYVKAKNDRNVPYVERSIASAEKTRSAKARGKKATQQYAQQKKRQTKEAEVRPAMYSQHNTRLCTQYLKPPLSEKEQNRRYSLTITIRTRGLRTRGIRIRTRGIRVINTRGIS